jgi:hypothetical protein
VRVEAAGINPGAGRGVEAELSDEEPAKKSATSLVAMGIAGKWQQVGAIRLSIQNSGPAGAAVSLRFEVPADQNLASSSSALLTWGIELAS